MLGPDLGNRHALAAPGTLTRSTKPRSLASSKSEDADTTSATPEHLGVRARTGAQPLEEVEYKVIDVVGRRVP